jgi:hypothetical protein
VGASAVHASECLACERVVQCLRATVGIVHCVGQDYVGALHECLVFQSAWFSKVPRLYL